MYYYHNCSHHFISDSVTLEHISNNIEFPTSYTFIIHNDFDQAVYMSYGMCLMY